MELSSRSRHDFDPRRDYRLTLSDSELNDVERNAAAGRPLTADDIELDVTIEEP